MVDKSTARVLALAKSRGVKGAKLAEVAGVSPQSITKWKHGGAISEEKLIKLAEFFDTTVAELRYGTDRGKPSHEALQQLVGKYEVSPLPTAEEIAKAYEALPPGKKHLYAVSIFHDAALAEAAPWLNLAVPMKRNFSEYLKHVKAQLAPLCAQLSQD